MKNHLFPNPETAIELTPNYSEKQVYDIFYNHFLEIETKKRLEAIDLLKNNDFDKVKNNKYVGTKYKHKRIFSSRLNDLIEELNNFVLPLNSFDAVFVDTDNDENIGNFIRYSTYFIADNENVCIEKATNRARTLTLRIKHRPNNSELENALELFHQLTKEDKPNLIKNCSTCKQFSENNDNSNTVVSNCFKFGSFAIKGCILNNFSDYTKID